jgi:hypothetical protein
VPRRIALGPLALLGALAVLAATAGAAAAPKPITSADAKGDVRSALDLTRVSVARGQDGRLRASLTLARDWDGNALVAAGGPPGSMCVKLWTVSVPPDVPPDLLACVTATKDAELRGSVLRERANKLPERVAGAEVTRPSARTVTMRFSQTAIGRPAKLSFAAETTRPGCPRASCIDTAPDAPKTLELVLRKTP